MDHQEPAFGQRQRLQPLPDALGPGGLPVHENWNIGAELHAYPRQRLDIDAGSPQPVQCQQRGGGIGTAAAETAANFAPDWARSAVWYQIFVERFRNGDPANDPSSPNGP